MRKIQLLLLATLTITFSTSALAQSDAYNAGHDVGRQIGSFIKLYLPHLGAALVLTAVGVGCWALVRRRGK